MKLHAHILSPDGRIPAVAPPTDPAPRAADTAACLAHLAELASAVTLTVGRIVVMIAHEREGHAVAIYQDGALSGRGGPCSLAAAWAVYLHECARMTQVLCANIQTHVDATSGAPEAP
jgi:hypothetical protein